ncbi:MAG: SDR family oxidoreductase [Chloroflexi bacterium]|nr:SDR family oxidoreductase [Chloroflexota bacterium]
MADQAGRIAVVTGGGRGLGQGVALGLAGAGATVVAVARNAEQLGRTEELARDLAGSVTGITCDVADPGAVAALGDTVRERFGAPTILVNAAGVFGPIALIRDVDPTDWVRTVQIDAVAPFLTVRAFLAGMLDAGWGRIVNVTSAASLHPPGPLNSAYGTAKVALNQLTRHLAAEIAGSGVTANVIHPGDVRTDMWADIRDKVAAMGDIAEGYRSWVEWVDRTGGDPPTKAVDLVMRLTTDAAGDTNGRFCWIDDPLQAPIASWDEPVDERPWA